jgi:hypothetical protein
VLQRPGITAHTRQRFRLAEGSSIERDRAMRCSGTRARRAPRVIRHDLGPLPIILDGSPRSP